MRMSPLARSTLLACAAVTGCASGPPAATNAPAYAPLRGADCLDPAAARGWHEISPREIAVDAGRRRYRIALSAACMPTGTQLRFEGDAVSGRVCGHPFDAIVVGRERCRIERIELVEAADWQRVLSGEADAATPAR